MEIKNLEINKGFYTDLEAAKKLSDGEKVNDVHYAPIVCNPTESFEVAIHKDDIKGMDVLTIVGSGDYLYWILQNEPNSVATFDINRMAKLYQNLKTAGILTMTLREYVDFFFNNPTFFDKRYLLQITNALPKEEAKFWSRLIWPMSQSEIAMSSLFKLGNSIHNLGSSLTESEENYYKVREAIMTTSSTHYNVGVDELSVVRRKFDTIFIGNLSNVGPYENLEDGAKLVDAIADVSSKVNHLLKDEESALIMTLPGNRNLRVGEPRRKA